MIKNENIEALVRVIALAVAEGNQCRAEKILTWAYSGGNAETHHMGAAQKDKTEVFIEKYLTPQEKVTKREAREFANRYIKGVPPGEIDYKLVSERIRSMEYVDFLSTVYWKGVAYGIKSKYKACEICGSPTRLEVHHKTYKNHGDEIHHLEDLRCVCKACHENIHGIKDREEQRQDESKAS